ncbi:MAG: hypothetical protein WBG71_00070 [Leeuwenhoekiella sp.]
MQKQNEKIIPLMAVTVTPAQKQLLRFCDHLDAPEVMNSVERTLKTAIYGCKDELSYEERQKMFLVDELVNHFRNIVAEGKGPAV